MLLFCLQFCSKQNDFKAIKMSQEDSHEYFQPEIGKIVQDHSACAKKKRYSYRNSLQQDFLAKE